MSLTTTDVKKIAQLAKLNLTDTDLIAYTSQLSTILNFVEQMSTANTDAVVPSVHSLNESQPLRPDVVTEINERKAFQAIAPQVESGLYLVPQVIEG
jgi:aspartyl-tRNA(Asn)/glutamyl-tRNA(Gln) amidotransferase subunit C